VLGRTLSAIAAAAMLVLALASTASPHIDRLIASPGSRSCPVFNRFELRMAADRTYDDGIEDAGAAPDFCGGNVVNNDNEAVKFVLHVHNRSVATPGDEYAILLDVDSNPATGESGADYRVSFAGTASQLERWGGATFVPTGIPSAVRVDWEEGMGPAVRVRLADIGNPTAFNFAFVSRSGADGDVAPDAGMWSYQLTRLDLTVRSFTRGPAKAGTALVTRMLVHRSDSDEPLTEGTIACVAKLAGKPLRGAGAFAGERATCTWRLPKNARSKRVEGSMTVSFQGVRVARSFSVRVA
jgi:hypothetical protein